MSGPATIANSHSSCNRRGLRLAQPGISCLIEDAAAIKVPSSAQRVRMNWISNVVTPKIRSFMRRESPENLWVKCPDSGELVFHKDLEANLNVVPSSGYPHAHAGEAAARDPVRRRPLGGYRHARRAAGSAEVPRREALQRTDSRKIARRPPRRTPCASPPARSRASRCWSRCRTSSSWAARSASRRERRSSPA